MDYIKTVFVSDSTYAWMFLSAVSEDLPLLPQSDWFYVDYFLEALLFL